jgi:hypothetical protein
MAKRYLLDPKSGKRIVLIDSITELDACDKGLIVISGSHGGVSIVEYTLRYPPSLVFLNDAGIGKDNAGIQALSVLDQHDVAAATYSHMTARIGDAEDALRHGIISCTNTKARHLGYLVGQLISDLILCYERHQTDSV